MLYRGEHFNIVNFGIFAALDGIMILVVFLFYLFMAQGQITTDLMRMTFLLPVFVWSGAKLFFWGAQGVHFLSNPKEYVRQTGFYVQGGILGGAVWALMVTRLTGISLLLIGDGLSWGFLLGQFFGRLGCFNYGCCYGKHSHGPFSINYHNEEAKVLRLHPELKNVPLIPSQLYQSLVNLMAFVAFSFLIVPLHRNGLVMGLFLVYYGTARMLFEKIRADIYFDGKRKWLTFYVSMTAAVIGVFYLSAGHLLIPQTLTSFSPALPVSLGTLAVLFRTTPMIGGLFLWTSIWLFLGYGIHGKILGTLPSFKPVVEWSHTDRPAAHLKLVTLKSSGQKQVVVKSGYYKNPHIKKEA